MVGSLSIPSRSHLILDPLGCSDAAVICKGRTRVPINSRPEDVLLCMDQRGGVPSVQEYKRLLQQCIQDESLSGARRVRAHLARNGLELHRCLGEYVVNALAKCGSMVEAVQLFHRLSRPSTFCWTALISGYTRAGQAEEAVRLFRQMQEKGVQPSKFTFVSLLKACGSLEDLDEGHRVHAHVLRCRCETDLYVATALVDMYAKCGSMADARCVFDTLAEPDVVAWTAMIAGYAQQQEGHLALQLYAQMQEVGVPPDTWTLVSVLKACSSIADTEENVSAAFVEGQGQFIKPNTLRKCRAIHAQIVHLGYEAHEYIASSLVSVYSKCGNLTDAQAVFDKLSRRTVVSWNAMLAAYVQQEQCEKAIQLYTQMQQQVGAGTGAGAPPPEMRTLVSVLKACGSLAALEASLVIGGQDIKVRSLQKGRALHAEVARWGYGSDVFVGSTLVSMYAKCGSIRDAQLVFDTLAVRNVVSWNALLEAYAQQEKGEMALQVYGQMLEAGIAPDAWTFASALKACGGLAGLEEGVQVDGRCIKVETLQKGKLIHDQVGGHGCKSDLIVCNALLSMYAKCGSLVDAQNVFDVLQERDVVSWSCIITGYAQQEDSSDRALQLYAGMRHAGFRADEATFLGVLRACGNTGALDKCGEAHRDVVDSGLDGNLCVANSLIHAYGKCGSMVDAQAVFNTLLEPSVVSWSALIAGYARQGNCEMSYRSFEDMVRAGMMPDGATFLSLLSACSHAGLVDKGLEYFESMSRDHGVRPASEHYACLVDLVGRGGLLSKAESVIMDMPMEPSLSLWMSLLGACRNHGNIMLGRRAFDRAVAIAPTHGSAYLLMSNMYAHAGLWSCVLEIEELRQRAGAWRKLGQSWLEHNQEVHSFVAGGEDGTQESSDVHRLVDELTWKLKQGQL